MIHAPFDMKSSKSIRETILSTSSSMVKNSSFSSILDTNPKCVVFWTFVNCLKAIVLTVASNCKFWLTIFVVKSASVTIPIRMLKQKKSQTHTHSRTNVKRDALANYPSSSMMASCCLLHSFSTANALRHVASGRTDTGFGMLSSETVCVHHQCLNSLTGSM